jgi:valyl-tRNA synthetase
MAQLFELIRRIRNARAIMRVPHTSPIPANIVVREREALLKENLDWVAPLAYLDPGELAVLQADAFREHPTEGLTQISAGPYTCYLPLFDRPAERERLANERDRLIQRITHSEELLAGEFGRRAPAEIVDREREKLAQMRSSLKVIQEQLGP